MITIKEFFTISTKGGSKSRWSRYRLALPVAVAGFALIFTARAQTLVRPGFFLAPASDTIAACLPNAIATVTVFPKEELRGVDTLDLRAEGLPPNAGFSVFLTELAVPNFGAAEYIGQFETNASGRGTLRVDTVIDEAFSTTVVDGGTRVRKDLNHIVLWFSNPADDDFCFAPALGPTTPFDGDGQAGAAVLSSRTFLPGAPLP